MGMVDERAALQIQNLLICIEMLLASLAHFYIFPYYEWQDGYKREKEKETGPVHLRDTLALRDFVSDMRMLVKPWHNDGADGGSPASPSATTNGRDVEGGRGDEEEEDDNGERKDEGYQIETKFSRERGVSSGPYDDQKEEDEDCPDEGTMFVERGSPVEFSRN